MGVERQAIGHSKAKEMIVLDEFHVCSSSILIRLHMISSLSIPVSCIAFALPDSRDVLLSSKNRSNEHRESEWLAGTPYNYLRSDTSEGSPPVWVIPNVFRSQNHPPFEGSVHDHLVPTNRQCTPISDRRTRALASSLCVSMLHEANPKNVHSKLRTRMQVGPANAFRE